MFFSCNGGNEFDKKNNKKVYFIWRTQRDLKKKEPSVCGNVHPEKSYTILCSHSDWLSATDIWFSCICIAYAILRCAEELWMGLANEVESNNQLNDY